MDTTQYYIYKGITDEEGKIDIFFDDLRDGETYYVFITGGNYLPYDPPFLLDDSDVRKVVFTTPKNKNLNYKKWEFEKKLVSKSWFV